MTATTRGRVTAQRGGSPARPPSVSAALHARPTLEVAVLAAVLVEERHPRLLSAVADDERHPWQRVLDTTALLRAGTADPLRAMGLAARERVLSGEHVRPEGHDPDLLALRHALRLHCVLLTSAAAGRPVSPAAAEDYVREQRSTAVLLGAEPDDLPATLAEVDEDVSAVRAELDLTLRAFAAGHQEAPPGSWAQTERLALGVLPDWARGARAPLSGERLAEELRRL